MILKCKTLEEAPEEEKERSFPNDTKQPEVNIFAQKRSVKSGFSH